MNQSQKTLSKYSKEEIKNLINDKTRLVFVDNGKEEFVARYEDLPDIIVGLNVTYGHNQNLKVYDTNDLLILRPILTTIGYFLDYCDQNVRKDIIDRLIALQKDEIEIKDFKIIDEDEFEDIKIAIENETEMER